MSRFNSKGGMQSSSCNSSLYCKCRKETGHKLIISENKEICLHFGKNKAYWHIWENGIIKRTFTKPVEMS